MSIAEEEGPRNIAYSNLNRYKLKVTDYFNIFCLLLSIFLSAQSIIGARKSKMSKNEKYNLLFRPMQEMCQSLAELDDEEFGDKLSIFMMMKEYFENGINFIPTPTIPIADKQVIIDNDTDLNGNNADVCQPNELASDKDSSDNSSDSSDQPISSMKLLKVKPAIRPRKKEQNNASTSQY